MTAVGGCVLVLQESALIKLVEHWKNGSREDLESSRIILFEGKRYAPAMFYLHLALEKALKSYCVEKFKEHAPFTHNLPVLLEKLEWEVSDEHAADLAEINQFNTLGRYPDFKESVQSKFTKAYVESYFQKGEVLWKWIMSH
jgi:HEPN domain-containing protein